MLDLQLGELASSGAILAGEWSPETLIISQGSVSRLLLPPRTDRLSRIEKP